MRYTSAPLLVLMMATSGCVGRGAGLFAFGAVTGAVVAAAIISSRPPPPPRVVVMPEPRAGYVWSPGYWTLQDDQWVWVDGQWLPIREGYQWSPTHWEGTPDGQWKLVPGQWVLVSPG